MSLSRARPGESSRSRLIKDPISSRDVDMRSVIRSKRSADSDAVPKRAAMRSSLLVRVPRAFMSRSHRTASAIESGVLFL